MRISKILVVAMVAALGAVGCGDDDGGGSGGTAGNAGTGGSSGTGGTAGNAGTGGGGITMCGSTMCAPLPEAPGGGGGTPLPIPLPMPEICCTEGDNLCGVSADGLLKAGSCLEQNAPGMPSAMCDEETLTINFGIEVVLTLAPCCTPDGECGLSTISSPLLAALGMDEIDLGTGCTERAELAAAIDTAMFGNVTLDWASASCTYEAGMDGGVDDAGN